MSGDRHQVGAIRSGVRPPGPRVDQLRIVSCTCDPRHLDVGAYDQDCFIHRPIEDRQPERPQPERPQVSVVAGGDPLVTAKRERP